MIRAVLFDVDFTLIQPGPMFRAEGYRTFCARYGIAVDPARFDVAVAGGLRGVFLYRRSAMPARVDELAVLGIPTIRTLDDLPAALARIDEYSLSRKLGSRSVRL